MARQSAIAANLVTMSRHARFTRLALEKDMTPEEQLQGFEELLDHLKHELHKRQFRPEQIGTPTSDWFEKAACSSSPVQCDYFVARGWYDKMLDRMKDGADEPIPFERANAAGRNMLDAILRVFTRIGIDKAYVDEFMRARGFDV